MTAVKTVNWNAIRIDSNLALILGWQDLIS